jgi:hypothetical protein
VSLTGNTGTKRIPSMAAREGNFLEAMLPVRAFATLTAPQQLSQGRLSDFFHCWAIGIQRHEQITLGWIKSVELRPRRHIHAALVAAAPLDCDFAAESWRGLVAPRYASAAKVEAYQKGRCGLGYVLKTLDTPYEDAEVSPNLSAFAPSLKAHFRPNSAQKRQRRRIKTQLEAHKGFGR